MLESQLNILPLVQLLRQNSPVILLESQTENHPAGKKSYLAAKAQSWIRVQDGRITIHENGEDTEINSDPWTALKEFRRINDWVFGYFGYDLKNSVEDLSSANPELVEVPDMYFFCPELLFEIDSAGLLKVLKGDGFPAEASIPEIADIKLQIDSQISKEKYLQMVKHIQQDIFEGEYYELNFSHPLTFDFRGDALQLYDKMKEINPVPFAAFFEMEGFSVCSSSPERFLARSGNRVWSQPIKGTLKSETGSEDEIRRLQHSEKDRAENLMIVDLVRNDLNRVCKKNSVKVSNLFEIQSFNTVHQMVSTVEGEVDEQTDSVDIIKNCFPMGSMTGAPKIAAMKSIDTYENYRRGIYSGAMGYFDPENNFDFNVLIRTAVIANKKLVYPIGGAITSDSIPEVEWEETMTKAKGIIDLITG